MLPSPYPKANSEMNQHGAEDEETEELNTQTISLSNIVTSEQIDDENVLNIPDNLDIIYETQSEDQVSTFCSVNFSSCWNSSRVCSAC